MSDSAYLQKISAKKPSKKLKRSSTKTTDYEEEEGEESEHKEEEAQEQESKSPHEQLVEYCRASQTGGRDPARGRVTNFRGRRDSQRVYKFYAKYCVLCIVCC